MKKTFSAMLIGGFFIFQSCEGPPGPTGMPGQDGQDGINLLSEVFEVNANFTNENNFEAVFNLDPPIFDSDVVLVFLQWETIENNIIWRALPQTLFFQEGELIYNFDFSRVDFRLFLDITFDPELLDSEWTNNQVFRIVIVPGEFSNARLDLTDYESVMRLINASEDDVVQLNQKQ